MSTAFAYLLQKEETLCPASGVEVTGVSAVLTTLRLRLLTVLLGVARLRLSVM
jgi:hypothetical protein